MRLRLLISFVVGAIFFTVLPIYAPFVVLQADEMPRFLLGLGLGVVAGVGMALVTGTRPGFLLAVACAFVGASLYVFVYAIPTYGMVYGGQPTVLSFASSYSVIMPHAFSYLALPAAVGVGLVGLARLLVGLLRRSRRRP